MTGTPEQGDDAAAGDAAASTEPAGQTADAELAQASAAIDELLADLPEDQARELLELALTEVVMKADPEAE